MNYWDQYKEGIEKVHAGLFDLLPERDLPLIVLRGHVLIEELMTELIDQLSKKPEILKDAGFSFNQKLCIVHAVFGDIKNVPTFYDCIENLNNLRNCYSQDLAPEDIRREVIAFIHLFLNDEGHPVVPPDDKFTDDGITRHLRKCIVMLLIGLQGALEGYRAATKFERRDEMPDRTK